MGIPLLDTAAQASFEALSSPASRWETLPTFVLGEYAILLAAALGLVHAIRSGPVHRLVWLAALVAGTANDLIFMALPLVDNFWHGQATLMLTPRLPLYIPALYVLFMYFPTVAVARVGLPRWPTAALAALLAVATYAPFDIVGAKFLWWTWHDTDLPIRARLFGVPTSSTLWVLTFSGAFAWLVAPSLLSQEPPSARARAWVLVRVAGLTTLGMMLQMTPLQQIDGGAPAYRALAFGLALYAVIGFGGAWRHRARVVQAEPPAAEPLPLGAMLLHLATLAVAIAGFDPASHVSTGLHEPVGPCDATATDITGAVRRAYLCVTDFDEDYDFRCTTTPAEGARWYTVCGRPFTDRAGFVGAVLTLCVLSALAYVRLFGGVGARSGRRPAGEADTSRGGAHDAAA